MTKLQSYLKTAHHLLKDIDDVFEYQSLLGTQVLAKDFDGALLTASGIADAEDRWIAFSDAILHEPAEIHEVLVGRFFEGVAFEDCHLDFLDVFINDPKQTSVQLHRYLDQTADGADHIKAAIWEALAQRGETDGAIAFFAAVELPTQLRTTPDASIAVGYAKNGDLDAASTRLRMAEGYYRRAALGMIAPNAPQDFMDAEVDDALTGGPTDGPNVARNILIEMLKLPGQWPRLKPFVDQLEPGEQPWVKFEAVWKSEGNDTAWYILEKMPEDQVNNLIVGAFSAGNTYFLHRAFAELSDETLLNNLRNLLVHKAIKAGNLDQALGHLYQITPVQEPPNSMQPYYRDSTREHVIEALGKAGRLDDQLALYQHFEQVERQLRWASNLALSLVAKGRSDEAKVLVDQFNEIFGNLSPTVGGYTSYLHRKAANFVAFDQFDDALALVELEDEFGREAFPAAVAEVAAKSGRHLDRLEKLIDQTWEGSDQNDLYLLNTVIAACYALEAARAN